MQDEGQPFGRGQRFEHNQQRQADRVGEQRFVLGIGALGGVDDRVGHADVERLLVPRVPRAERVQRDARDDGRQPAAEVLDLARVRATDPEPRVLDGVVSFADRSQHAIGDRAQPRPVIFELTSEPFLLIHVTFPFPEVSWD